MAGAQQQIDYFTGPCPYDDCRFRQRCGAERLAYHRFQMFVDGAGAQRWCHAPCAPSRAWFNTAFHGNKTGRPRKRATQRKGVFPHVRGK
jgi:hypothetical protein